MSEYKEKITSKLLKESTLDGSSQVGRPSLVGLTRATTKLVYSELVAVQRTKQPEASLYGIKYLYPDKQMSALSGSTYGGEVTYKERIDLPRYPDVTDFKKGDKFVSDDYIFKALVDAPFTGIPEDSSALLTASMLNNIRMLSGAAPTGLHEEGITDNSSIVFDKWTSTVKTRKIKTQLTIELAQDLEANGFDADETIQDLLSTQAAEEINKDIIQTLITVSSRFLVKGQFDNGILDFTTMKSDDYIGQGRLLYQYACEMNANIQANTSYAGSYVLASSRCCAVLSASGFLTSSKEADVPDNAEGLLKNGLTVYIDNNAPFDYLLVGVKENYGDLEHIGSLFYSPYIEGLDIDENEDIGNIKVAVDPASLQPTLQISVRYALSVNPYTVAKGSKDERVYRGDDFDNLSGRSQMSVILGVKLPELILLEA